MKPFSIFPLAALGAALVLGACASNSPAPAPGETALRAPAPAEAERIMRTARALRKEKGCAQAAPSFRVAAAMGKGFEAAQHELGECLLTMAADGDNATNAMLYEKEAMFWLERAAFAGNARAQRKLSTLFGAAAGPHADARAALSWALVYEANGEADLYGYQSLPPTFAPGLERSLSDHEVDEARRFAENFSAVHLGVYAPPPRAQQGDGEARRQRPDGQSGERRQRRR